MGIGETMRRRGGAEDGGSSFLHIRWLSLDCLSRSTSAWRWRGILSLPMPSSLSSTNSLKCCRTRKIYNPPWNEYRNAGWKLVAVRMGEMLVPKLIFTCVCHSHVVAAIGSLAGETILN